MHQSTFFGGHENHQKCVKKSKYGTIFRENRRKWSKPLVQKPVGVVEAAGSSPVTQTRNRKMINLPIFLYFTRVFRTFRGADFCFLRHSKMSKKTQKIGLVQDLVQGFKKCISKKSRGCVKIQNFERKKLWQTSRPKVTEPIPFTFPAVAMPPGNPSQNQKFLNLPNQSFFTKS